MTVHRYHTVNEMPRPPRVVGEELVKRLRALWDRAFQLAPPHFARGVTRFRNMNEANRARELATIERMRMNRPRP